MQRCIIPTLLLCLFSALGAAQQLNQNAISVYISYNLPVKYLPGAAVRTGPIPGFAEISCRNNFDQPVNVSMTCNITELNGLTPPIDPRMRQLIVTTELIPSEPAVFSLLPQQMKTIAIRSLPYGSTLSSIPYLLQVQLNVTAGKETVPIHRVFPLVFPGGQTFTSSWTTVNGVSARVSIITWWKTIDVKAEIRNDTAKSISFNDIPSITGDIAINGGGPVQPSAGEAIDREAAPFTLPAGTTITLPLSRGSYDDQTGEFRMNFTAAAYALKVGMYYLDARLHTTFGPEGTGIEWKIPRFPFMLRWPDMVPIYAPNPNDGWIEYPE